VRFAPAGARGVFAALAPQRSGVPDLAAMVPDEATLRTAWQVDWGALWDVFGTVMAGLQERSVAQTRERLQKTCGDVARDLVPQLRSDVLLVCGRAAPDDGAVPFARAGLVVPVQDPERLAAAIEPLVTACGGHLLPAADGARAGDIGFVHVFVGDGVLVVGSAAHGPELAARVRARLATNGVPPAKFADVGAGVSGAGSIDVGTFLRGELHAALRLLPVLLGGEVRLPDLAGLGDEVERWVPQLRLHRLETAAIDLRGRPDEVVVRVLW
jgi:hypothetical protein